MALEALKQNNQELSDTEKFIDRITKRVDEFSTEAEKIYFDLLLEMASQVVQRVRHERLEEQKETITIIKSKLIADEDVSKKSTGALSKLYTELMMLADKKIKRVEKARKLNAKLGKPSFSERSQTKITSGFSKLTEGGLFLSAVSPTLGLSLAALGAAGKATTTTGFAVGKGLNSLRKRALGKQERAIGSADEDTNPVAAKQTIADAIKDESNVVEAAKKQKQQKDNAIDKKSEETQPQNITINQEAPQSPSGAASESKINQATITNNGPVNYYTNQDKADGGVTENKSTEILSDNVTITSNTTENKTTDILSDTVNVEGSTTESKSTEILTDNVNITTDNVVGGSNESSIVNNDNKVFQDTFNSQKMTEGNTEVIGESSLEIIEILEKILAQQISISEGIAQFNARSEKEEFDAIENRRESRRRGRFTKRGITPKTKDDKEDESNGFLGTLLGSFFGSGGAGLLKTLGRVALQVTGITLAVGVAKKAFGGLIGFVSGRFVSAIKNTLMAVKGSLFEFLSNAANKMGELAKRVPGMPKANQPLAKESVNKPSTVESPDQKTANKDTPKQKDVGKEKQPKAKNMSRAGRAIRGLKGLKNIGSLLSVGRIALTGAGAVAAGTALLPAIATAAAVTGATILGKKLWDNYQERKEANVELSKQNPDAAPVMTKTVDEMNRVSQEVINTVNNDIQQITKNTDNVENNKTNDETTKAINTTSNAYESLSLSVDKYSKSISDVTENITGLTESLDKSIKSSVRLVEENSKSSTGNTTRNLVVDQIDSVRNDMINVDKKSSNSINIDSIKTGQEKFFINNQEVSKEDYFSNEIVRKQLEELNTSINNTLDTAKSDIIGKVSLSQESISNLSESIVSVSNSVVGKEVSSKTSQISDNVSNTNSTTNKLANVDKNSTSKSGVVSFNDNYVMNDRKDSVSTNNIVHAIISNSKTSKINLDKLTNKESVISFVESYLGLPKTQKPVSVNSDTMTSFVNDIVSKSNTQSDLIRNKSTVNEATKKDISSVVMRDVTDSRRSVVDYVKSITGQSNTITTSNEGSKEYVNYSSMNQLKELVSKVTQEAVVSPQAKALDVFARRTEMAKMMATSNSTGTAVVNNMGGTSMSSSNVTNNNVTNVMPADDSSFKMASLNQNKYNFIG
jgi:hypothetical protein